MSKAVTLEQLELSLNKVKENSGGGGGSISIDYVKYLSMPSVESEEYYMRMVYGNGICIAPVIGSNKYAYSTDGLHWELKTYQHTFTKDATCDICYSSGYFIVVGGDGVVLRSSDGLTWTQHSHPIRITSTMTRIRCIAYSRNIIATACGLFTEAKTNIAHSTDGINWTSVSNPSPRIFNNIGLASRKFIGITYYGEISYSNDGSSWVNHSTTLSDTGWDSVAGSFSSGMIVSTNGKCAYLSGTSLKVTERTMPEALICGFHYVDPEYVVIDDNIIHYTADNGVTWTSISGPYTNHSCFPQSSRFDNFSYIMNCQSSIFVSNDGIHWSSHWAKMLDSEGNDISDIISAIVTLNS